MLVTARVRVRLGRLAQCLVLPRLLCLVHAQGQWAGFGLNHTRWLARLGGRGSRLLRQAASQETTALVITRVYSNARQARPSPTPSPPVLLTALQPHTPSSLSCLPSLALSSSLPLGRVDAGPVQNPTARITHTAQHSMHSSTTLTHKPDTHARCGRPLSPSHAQPSLWLMTLTLPAGPRTSSRFHGWPGGDTSSGLPLLAKFAHLCGCHFSAQPNAPHRCLTPIRVTREPQAQSSPG